MLRVHEKTQLTRMLYLFIVFIRRKDGVVVWKFLLKTIKKNKGETVIFYV